MMDTLGRHRNNSGIPYTFTRIYQTAAMCTPVTTPQLHTMGQAEGCIMR